MKHNSARFGITGAWFAHCARVAGVIVTVLAIVSSARSARAAERVRLPNIVVILADDYGYGSCGCYGADGKLVRTPNIDRLAREGRRFTDANTTSSVCSPTRYSVLTGRYCWRTSLTHEVLGTFSPLHIETTRLNLASLLKAHGYQTAAIGKWHLGYGTADGTPRWRTDYTAELSPGPLDLGFDYHFGVPSNHGDLTGIYVENRFVYGLRNGKIPPGMKPPGPVPDDDNFKATYTKEDTEAARIDPMAIDAPRRVNDHVMPLLTDKAVAFIERQKPQTPFFLYFTPVAVHSPVTPSKDLAGKSRAGLYGDWIHELDRSVGRVLESLDKQGLAENTLVIFTSDNGGVREPQNAESPQTLALKAGLAVNGPLRGGKHHIWEGGFKVPFIVRWPGKAAAGSVCDEMVNLADILATTAAIVGDKLPPAAKAAEDSYNILPAILGDSYAKPLRPDMIVHSTDGVFAVRKGPWKWIEGIPADDITLGARRARADEFHAQLYNLKNDPAEGKDVIAEHPEVAKQLEALLERYRDGGYSRELPPPASSNAQPAIALPPLGTNIVLKETLDKVPGPPWVRVRGRWVAKDGAVLASQTPAEQGPAALRSPLAIGDGDIQYEVSLPPGASHTLRVQCRDRDHVLQVAISNQRLAILNPTAGGNPAKGASLAQQRVRFRPNTWVPVRVSFRGQDIFLQAGGSAIKAAHPFAAEPKVAFALLANGNDVGFARVVVAK
jgi:arylsulfatase A-like enzyme